MEMVLTELQWKAMRIIHDSPGISGKKITEALGVETRHQLVYPFLFFAETNGLVTRTFSGAERGRPYNIALTPQGEKLLKEHEEHVLATKFPV